MSFEEKCEEIAQKADEKISKEAGDSAEQYIEGLDIILSLLQCNLDAAREELDA